MTDRKRRSFGTIGDKPGPTLRDLTIRSVPSSEDEESPPVEDRAAEPPPPKKAAPAKAGKGHRVVSLSLPLAIDEVLAARSKAEDVGRGRIVWMAYQRHSNDVADVNLPSGRKVMTRVYLHSPEIEDIDATADALGFSRSRVVAAVLHKALV